MISVAMASYNGARYIREQMDSILMQLNPEDELIISDDGSTDDTVQTVQEYTAKDGRIRLIRNPGKGVVSNFENAVKACGGDYIFLCDQDDVWVPGKVKTVMDAFRGGADLVLSDAIVADENLHTLHDSFYAFNRSRAGMLRNILHNSFHGCTMAFNKKIRDIALPFSRSVPMHDIWLGQLALLFGKVTYLPDKLVIYRRHGGNATGYQKSSLWQKFWWRACIVFPVFTRAVKQLIIKN